MDEKTFQSSFTKWAKKNIRTSTAFELKLCKKNSIPFSAVQEHQVASLYVAKHQVLFHKISDLALGFHPFDCLALAGAEAYVVVMFYKPGHRRFCYMIDVDDFMLETTKPGRRSLTEARAKEIGKVIDLLVSSVDVAVNGTNRN